MSEKSTAWADYLATAHRLDAVRREAAEAAAAEAEAVAAARGELPGVQARLSIQAGRLLESALQAGAAPPALVPNQVERHTAAKAVEGGPHVVLTALRQARSEVDVADSALTRLDEPDAAQTRRNLLIYASAGAAATVVQIIFALLTDPRTREIFAAACGLVMALLLWAAAWVTVGMLFPRRPRTAQLGLIAVFTPVILVALLFILV